MSAQATKSDAEGALVQAGYRVVSRVDLFEAAEVRAAGGSRIMTYHDHPAGKQRSDEGRWRSFLTTPAGFALCVFLAIAGVFLWGEHRAHILGVLPLLLPLLICVGMHFFMHRGHGGHGGQSGGGHER